VGGWVDEDEPVRVAKLHLCSGQLVCDSSRASTFRIRSSDPQAILPPVQRFVNGIARNIPITLQAAGTQTVIAEDTVYPFSASRTVQVRISAIAGYRISFARQVSAGEPVQFTLRATDQYGNTIPQYSGRARLSSSDRRAEFPGIVIISNEWQATSRF